jgi:hypothetical protein
LFKIVFYKHISINLILKPNLRIKNEGKISKSIDCSSKQVY